jgi:hypothetical protein
LTLAKAPTIPASDWRISLRALIYSRKKGARLMAAQLIAIPVQARTPQRRHTDVAATLDLSRPGSIDRLNEVASDWLYEHCGADGRRRLLEEHDLLAA